MIRVVDYGGKARARARVFRSMRIANGQIYRVAAWPDTSFRVAITKRNAMRMNDRRPHVARCNASYDMGEQYIYILSSYLAQAQACDARSQSTH